MNSLQRLQQIFSPESSCADDLEAELLDGTHDLHCWLPFGSPRQVLHQHSIGGVHQGGITSELLWLEKAVAGCADGAPELPPEADETCLGLAENVQGILNQEPG